MSNSLKIKIAYITILLLYIITGIAFFLKAEISYRIVKIRPELVEIRSLTYAEYEALNSTDVIKSVISKTFMYSSIFVFLISAVLLRYKLFNPILLVKIVSGISLFISVLLVLIDSINFIPTGPLV